MHHTVEVIDTWTKADEKTEKCQVRIQNAGLILPFMWLYRDYTTFQNGFIEVSVGG